MSSISQKIQTLRTQEEILQIAGRGVFPDFGFLGLPITDKKALMNPQSTGRNQKPKGFKVKLVFRIALFLAVCFWLLYQMKYSNGKGYSEKHSSDILGRKGNAGSEGANVVGESVKKGDGEDEVLDGKVDEKNEESLHKAEMKYKEMNNTDDNSSIEVKENDELVGINKNSLHKEKSQEGNDEVGEEKEQKSHVNDVEDEKEKENSAGDGESKSEGVVHGFDDVNGVPLDGHDLTGSIGDHAINQTETDENSVNEGAASKEGTFEVKGKISVDDSVIDIKPKVETTSGLGVYADTTRIDSVSETTQGGDSVSDS